MSNIPPIRTILENLGHDTGLDQATIGGIVGLPPEVIGAALSRETKGLPPAHGKEVLDELVLLRLALWHAGLPPEGFRALEHARLARLMFEAQGVPPLAVALDVFGADAVAESAGVAPAVVDFLTDAPARTLIDQSPGAWAGLVSLIVEDIAATPEAERWLGVWDLGDSSGLTC